MYKFTKPLFDRIQNYILEDELLVHLSLYNDIKQIIPSKDNYVYTTDNLAVAIPLAIRKKFFIKGFLRLNTYTFCSKKFTICSIANEYSRELLNTELTIYYCKKSEFKKKRNYNKKNLVSLFIKKPGHDYITSNCVTPLKSETVTIDSLFNYSMHSVNSKKTYVTIRNIVTLLFKK